MKTHQQRILQSIEASLEEWDLEMTWDQTVASNVGYVGAVSPGQVIARRRLYVNFQGDYATFKPVLANHITDKGTIYVNFDKPNANAEFKKVLAYLCGEA